MGRFNEETDSMTEIQNNLPGATGHALRDHGSGIRMRKPIEIRIFYGWWVVAVAFLNLFFVVGIIFWHSSVHR